MKTTQQLHAAYAALRAKMVDVEHAMLDALDSKNVEVAQRLDTTLARLTTQKQQVRAALAYSGTAAGQLSQVLFG